jgi:hypothetical protein
MARIQRIVYCGPTLYGVAVERLKGEVWRGPAAQGDIMRDMLYHDPRQIVLIDGVFHQSLSVWHKELMYAMLKGVVCIGAASMGALRAAELHRYGMIGVGRVFEMYRDGEEDDALVALEFEPETFRPLREAPIGSDLKRQDALQAIELARTYRGKPKLNLDKKAIVPYLKLTLQRIFLG